MLSFVLIVAALIILFTIERYETLLIVVILPILAAIFMLIGISLFL